MNAVEVIVRAGTYAAAMLMFGASLFVVYARSGVPADGSDDPRHHWHTLRRRVWRLQLASAVATLVAGLLWLVVRSATVADVPLAHAMSNAVAGEVLRATLFGHAMAWHLGFAAAVLGILALGRSADETPPFRNDVVRAVLSAGVLATLAWMGHAAGTRGVDGYVHLGCDVVHLLAAGAWVGALPPLAAVLVRAGREQSFALDHLALCTTQRFSALGAVCVGAVLVTGTINGCYLVATPAALFGTTYGRLLLLKVALFAAMAALAARNRFILTPRVRQGFRADTDAARVAMRGIARNAWKEALLGVGVALIVGVLGMSVPAAHIGLHTHMH
jgi:putative copper resistance protein D